MKPKTIWVVMEGEKKEGGEIVKAFTSYALARRCALNVKHHFEKWVEVKPDYWESGCDWLEVKEFEIADGS